MSVQHEASPDSGGDCSGASNPRLESRNRNVSEGDFLLVKFDARRSVVYYAALVDAVDVDSSECSVRYLRRQKPSRTTFTLPEKDDSSWVSIDDVSNLPMPFLDNRGRYVFQEDIALAQ